MEIYKIKQDLNWVEKCITNKKNKSIHYPALKNLIKIFEEKWSIKSNAKVLNAYVKYLRSVLRSEFGR